MLTEVSFKILEDTACDDAGSSVLAVPVNMAVPLLGTEFAEVIELREFDAIGLLHEETTQ